MECSMSFVANTKKPQKSEILQKAGLAYGDKDILYFIKINTSKLNVSKNIPEENNYNIEGLSNEFF